MEWLWRGMEWCGTEQNASKRNSVDKQGKGLAENGEGLDEPSKEKELRQTEMKWNRMAEIGLELNWNGADWRGYDKESKR